jgi:hypothetical protein
MPLGRVSFAGWVDMVIVVLLEFGPEVGEMAADKVIPPNGLLRADQELVKLGADFVKFMAGEVSVRKVGTHAS